MLPPDTPRLRFREMTPEDLDLMAALLGDPEVMTYYPAPKTRDEAAQWIAWNEANYARHGYGLWIVETHDGEFLGDCGLTWQKINGQDTELEVGYHIRTGRATATRPKPLPPAGTLPATPCRRPGWLPSSIRKTRHRGGSRRSSAWALSMRTTADPSRYER